MTRRGRVELRRIEDRNSRQVRFSKRRSGLFKKACELSVLCDAEVALVVFSPAGRLYEFSSASSLEKTMDRYQKFMAPGDVGSHDSLKNHEKDACQEVDSKLMETGTRLLQTNFAKLGIDDLGELEKDLSDALKSTRSRKTDLMMDSINKLQEEEKLLLEKRRFLERAVLTMERSDGVAEAHSSEMPRPRDPHGMVSTWQSIGRCDDGAA